MSSWWYDTSYNTTSSSSTTSTTTTTTSTTYSFLRDKVFTAQNILYLVWLLGVVLIIIAVTAPADPTMVRVINVVITIWLLYLITWIYLEMSDADKADITTTLIEWTRDYFKDYKQFWYCLLVLFVMYFAVFLFAIPMAAGEKPFMISLIEGKLWVILIMFVVIYFFQELLQIQIVDKVMDEIAAFMNWILGTSSSTSTTTTSATAAAAAATVTTVSGGYWNISGGYWDTSGRLYGRHASGGYISASGEEVFNVANNLYTYDDAKLVCKALGARLATYDDVEDAYNNGAEWCSYGWSEGQMAFFPTQKSTWENLQKDPSRRNACGRPGINGGFMANKNIRFGVNCYGVKPAPKQKDVNLMYARIPPPAGVSAEDPVVLLEKAKTDFFKENADKILNINSFNGGSWSRF